MKQVLIRRGEVVVEETPAPKLEKGTALVAVEYSCISVGTELAGISSSGQSLWKRAINKPEQIKKVLEMVIRDGMYATNDRIQGKLAGFKPIGYSLAGRVINIGSGVESIKIGQRVACAGAQCANHAEIVRIPENLIVPIPDNLEFPEASTVALGAIALQGVRRAQPTLGESFVVIGLGVLGQLTVQLLKVNGCRVIGVDLDPSRLGVAESLGMDASINGNCVNDIDQVLRLTDGYGADGVIITAASSSDAIVSSALKMCRRKGRVVIVGDVGLKLDRRDFYTKELDVLISTSYGPGRYDDNYEKHGLDYPIGYVRWTENRNMAEYIRLLGDDVVNVSGLITSTYPLEKASEAYESLKSKNIKENKPLVVLLRYQDTGDALNTKVVVSNPKIQNSKGDRLRIAVVGAGNFAKNTHLPNLKVLSDKYILHAICGRSSSDVFNIAHHFRANYATTDYDDILNDKEVDAVLIATRHNLHASMVEKALTAGKHVLVEKPLAINVAELERMKSFFAERPQTPLLVTGFNRRFSPYMTRVRELIESRANPIIINYRMNAGHIPLEHWVHGGEGGGRNIGEASHIYDLFTYLTNARVIDVQAKSLSPSQGYYYSRDNFVTNIVFDDGSIAHLTYTALGAKAYSKEKMDLYFDGKVIEMDDYKKLVVYGEKSKGLETKKANKGQFEELVAFANAVGEGKSWPSPLWHQIQAMQIAFEVERQIS